jgi:CHAD domain-containing protein
VTDDDGTTKDATGTPGDDAAATPASGGQPVEVELKYRVTDPAAGQRLVDGDGLGDFVATGRAAKVTEIEDRYVDTETGALAAAGFAVRLRRRGRATIVSVKSLQHDDSAGGAVKRVELEGPAHAAAPPTTWPASDARAVVLEHAGDADLVERVTVRQRRQKRVLKAGRDRVELSLDDVDVVRGTSIAASFVELEAELMAGDEVALGTLAELLDAEHGLIRSSSSKLEAALAAVEGSSDTGRLAVGPTPGVVADDHVAEAGRKVMRFHLARMLDREAGTRSGIDPEDVHKMRVATRRQRAAWRVFGSSFRPRRTKRYRDGLREVAARLGAVRDLDVQLENADAYRADLPTTEQRALEPLLASWRSRREEARVLLLRELDSDGYRRFLDDYRVFVQTEGSQVVPVGSTEPHHVRDTAASRIWSAYEGVRAYEPVLRWADVETLHELRIAGKWLRYTLEFVREALTPESAVLIERVTALQDHLGLMNDAHITAGMARTFLVDHAAELSPLESAAIGRYLVDREREVARLRRSVGAPWRGVAGLRFRRGLGRVVAGL